VPVPPCSLSPVPILKSDVYTFTGFAAAKVAGATQPRQVGRGGGQHCDQYYVEPVPLSHLQGERAKEVRGPTLFTRSQLNRVFPAPAWKGSTFCTQPLQGDPFPVSQAVTDLLEVSSPVNWHGPEDCELKR
jgi:hypothetical protein